MYRYIYIYIYIYIYKDIYNVYINNNNNNNNNIKFIQHKTVEGRRMQQQRAIRSPPVKMNVKMNVHNWL